MTRRKLCVVCMEEPALVDGWSGIGSKCSASWHAASCGVNWATWAARRARAFERRRQSAELKYLRVRVRELGKQTASLRTVTLAEKVSK